MEAGPEGKTLANTTATERRRVERSTTGHRDGKERAATVTGQCCCTARLSPAESRHSMAGRLSRRKKTVSRMACILYCACEPRRNRPRRSPPEDGGGASGYRVLLLAQDDPGHPESLLPGIRTRRKNSAAALERARERLEDLATLCSRGGADQQFMQDDRTEKRYLA